MKQSISNIIQDLVASAAVKDGIVLDHRRTADIVFHAMLAHGKSIGLDIVTALPSARAAVDTALDEFEHYLSHLEDDAQRTRDDIDTTARMAKHAAQCCDLVYGVMFGNDGGVA